MHLSSQLEVLINTRALPFSAVNNEVIPHGQATMMGTVKKYLEDSRPCILSWGPLSSLATCLPQSRGPHSWLLSRAFLSPLRTCVIFTSVVSLTRALGGSGVCRVDSRRSDSDRICREDWRCLGTAGAEENWGHLPSFLPKNSG